ncbi:Eco57I restriction-modification methylase domain-containing protein [Streptomyces sp. RKCA744]|uniref:Eco57I restriction-modification methylase domain-containing protein n=1 Tax=Streptomyces sp. RKCA744 TaxID=2959340 RepID=UPI00209D8BD3|nr:type II restriction endonuclease subunit M [Streptomyces sp. RKCA744]MCO8302178.1 type II restriction endonuclease subunit M [Streptomyces sp. RKCA744]
MAFEAITNRGEYISAHYLAELFAKDLTELRKRWTSADRAGAPSSRSGVKGLRREYFKAKVRITETKAFDGPEVRELNDRLLAALAYVEPEAEGKDAEPAAPEPAGSTHTRLRRGDFEVMQGDKERSVPVALAVTGSGGLELVALDVTWQVDGELVVADVEDGGAQLLDPIQLDGKQLITSAADAVTFLFGCEDGYAPRYVLLLAGGAVLLADRTAWHEGHFLAVSVDEALDRNLSADGEELEAVAALFGAESLLTEGGVAGYLDGLVDKGRKHAVGVSKELREGLRQSVELIAQEILDRLKEGGADPAELGDPADLASRLTRESLRYLYRILFLLYAEARPELGILPSKDDAYQDGYGLARLGELVSYDLPEEAQDRFHFAESLDLLFRLVDQGHRPLGTDMAPTEDGVTVLDADGLRFEALRSDLFKADATPLIGSVSVEGERIDTRLRNKVLWRVLNLLMLTQGRRSGRGKAGGGTGKGFISYAQLGINQLGAVYEGLMSYTGFFAWDDLYEVAKPDSDGLSGTWVVPFEDADGYDEEVFVKRRNELTGILKRVEHKKGTFVYRLSGRERQRSASYYTPEVLTRSTVKHALAELLDQNGVTTPARAILDLTVCEPALGSGAFLNEAINQLAAEYLKRRMTELGGQQLPPDQYESELQKVKAYLALHNCYGVDLNQTAVELAEVSLWLNSMHEGLKAPWFGLHLRRGNSLVGARRAVYALEALKRKAWLTTVPTDRPLRAGAAEGQFQAGTEIHHFLLPAKGWGAVADAKQAKELAKDERDALAKWRTAVTATPSVAQGKRLLALATRVERLWELTRRRLVMSEREVRRQIDVWEVDPDQPLQKASGDVAREQIESALNEPGSPRGRLKLVMDAWCALWFWPVGQPDTPAPPSAEEWLAFCEAVLGTPAAKAKASSRRGSAAGLDDEFGLFADTGEFEKLAADDEFDRVMSQCMDMPLVTQRFLWLSEVDTISRREGFFHWELEFAHRYERGGFDLQVGNPPWVRLDWKDHLALAEHDSWFGLNEKAPEAVKAPRRNRVLRDPAARRNYLADLCSWAGLTESLSSPVDHPLLETLRTNLYLHFIERGWRNRSHGGTIGLIHPESHLTDPKATVLRSRVHESLKRHFQFRNELKLFSEIDNAEIFGIHVYGAPGAPKFLNINWLFHPGTIDESIRHDGSGEEPGIQFESGGWDCRPHAHRLIQVDEPMLASWGALVDPEGTAARASRPLRPVTVSEGHALRSLAGFPERLAQRSYWWTSALNETTAEEKGWIRRQTGIPSSLNEAILQGPHISVANPFAKQAKPIVRGNKDYDAWLLEDLPSSAVPRTNYVRACSIGEFTNAQRRRDGVVPSDHFRVCWRNMGKLKNERMLQAALIPPGPTHLYTIHAMSLGKNCATAAIGGLWSSLPMEYLLRVSGKEHIQVELMAQFPAPLEHPLMRPLLLRTLRLNFLTSNYSDLWEEMFDESWAADRWTSPQAVQASIQDVKSTWSMATPLRTEYDRRMALVEIDALVAVMFGLTAEQLCAMYRSQFSVLRKYEWGMFFAPDGHKIGAETYSVGVRQTPEETAFARSWAKAARAGDPTPAIPEGWVKPNREAEMTRAHADFTARLHAGEYGDYAAYLAEHPLTTPTPAPAESTATPTPAPESR